MDATDYVAIYGALLSTGVALWNISRARSKITVRLIFAAEKISGKLEHGLGVSVQNPSAKAVHITHIGFLRPFRDVSLWERLKHMFRYRRWPSRVGWLNTSPSLYGLKDGCPVTIESGNSYWLFVPHRVARKILKDAPRNELIAVVQDALWRDKRSARFVYNVQD